MHLTYIPLEPYKARYTEQLSVADGWAERAFKQKFQKVTAVRPRLKQNESTATIKAGKVLDTRQRPIWALEQMKILMHQPGTTFGKVYFDDIFTPGIEALPYSRATFKAYAFCWAQTFDIYDFTHGDASWMRPYELMAWSIMRRVYVACPMLKELITAAAPAMGEITEAVGLPFDSQAVAMQRDATYNSPRYDLVYSSRMDREKNPMLFLELVEKTGLKAAICTGHAALRGDDHKALEFAESLRSRNKLDVHVNLTKGQYYDVLANTHVQFNSAVQDWVSFTLLEALTYGCVPLYPNFRAFPETLNYEEDNLYTPFSLSAAEHKLKRLLDRPRNFPGAESILEYHDGTLLRIASSMFND